MLNHPFAPVQQYPAKCFNLGAGMGIGSRSAIGAFVIFVLAGGCSKAATPAIPAEIRPISTGLSGSLWLDWVQATLNAGCKPPSLETWSETLGLAYKPDNVQWPSAGPLQLLEGQLPRRMLFSRSARQQLIDGAVNAMKARGLFTDRFTKDGFLVPKDCPSIVAGMLAESWQTYSDSNGRVVRGLVNIGRVSFDGADLISEYQRAVPFKGFVAKYRKYKLRAHISGTPAIDPRRISLGRELTIYYDDADKIWRESETGTWDVSSGRSRVE